MHGEDVSSLQMDPELENGFRYKNENIGCLDIQTANANNDLDCSDELNGNLVIKSPDN